MNRDDIIRMAREAGLSITPPRSGQYNGGGLGGDVVSLKRFAALVAAAEREACAKVCDDQASEPECPERATYCAAAIRARTQQGNYAPCAGKPTNNPPSPGAWEFYQPCHHCMRRLATGNEPRPAPPEFVNGECPSRIGVAS